MHTYNNINNNNTLSIDTHSTNIETTVTFQKEGQLQLEGMVDLNGLRYCQMYHMEE